MFEDKIARVILNAWTDAEFLSELCDSPAAVLAQAGIAQVDGQEWRVLVDSEHVKHVVLTDATDCGDDLTEAVGRHLPLRANEELKILQNTPDLRYFVVPLAPAGAGEGLEIAYGYDPSEVVGKVKVVAEVLVAVAAVASAVVVVS